MGQLRQFCLSSSMALKTIKDNRKNTMAQKKVTLLPDTNPLADIISDKAYQELYRRGLLNKLGVRNHRIKNIVAYQKSMGMEEADAIDKARESFPYLIFETVRKIVKGRW
jgi:hypothetical protein